MKIEVDYSALCVVVTCIEAAWVSSVWKHSGILWCGVVCLRTSTLKVGLRLLFEILFTCGVAHGIDVLMVS